MKLRTCSWHVHIPGTMNLSYSWRGTNTGECAIENNNNLLIYILFSCAHWLFFVLFQYALEQQLEKPDSGKLIPVQHNKVVRCDPLRIFFSISTPRTRWYFYSAGCCDAIKFIAKSCVMDSLCIHSISYYMGWVERLIIRLGLFYKLVNYNQIISKFISLYVEASRQNIRTYHTNKLGGQFGNYLGHFVSFFFNIVSIIVVNGDEKKNQCKHTIFPGIQLLYSTLYWDAIVVGFRLANGETRFRLS
jgi:hypothetical protein